MDGERLENDSCVRRFVKLGLGRQEKFGQFELGKKTEECNGLSKVTEEAGRHQTLVSYLQLDLNLFA